MADTKWWQHSVVYQIYPQTFNDSNHDGVGDLAGIVPKIPYLVQLGVDVVWLNPIYQSPLIDQGYDISDYYQINPMYGTMADFDQLLQKLHAANLKLIMDLVVNHTSSQHAWFQASKQDRTNPYADFYIWKDPNPDGTPPTNWGSSFGGSTWEYVPQRQQYYLHLFAKEQPDLNWENPRVRQEVYKIMRFWLDKGVDGFRMDVISLLSKDPQYANSPVSPHQQYGSYYPGAANGPREHEYLQEMNREVLSHYDVMTVGETPHTSVQEALLYTQAERHELNMVFHFDHMHLDYGPEGKFSTKRFRLTALKQVFTKWQEMMIQNNGWNSLYWNNHDQARAVTRFGNPDPRWREQSAKMLATILHMQCGTPFIYQGEEIGMVNPHFNSINDYHDLDTLNVYHDFIHQKHLDPAQVMQAIYLKSRDNARTPIPWNDQPLTQTNPNLPPLNPDYRTVNVAQALADPASVFYYYQKLIKLRHDLPIITTGDYQLLDADDESTFSYLRTKDHQVLLVSGNFTDHLCQVQLPSKLQFTTSKLIISNFAINQQLTSQVFNLPPYGTVVYLLEQ
ncbi:Oligo-1,6-glucosidase (Oligosaccharide alpha-1,6-glucosidase) [Bombilactobacillus mellifer]|uniref:Oligo-1,6-glucosidase (Oligosaccharide alpha-1,6-glucosidase) n=1 Tax=Bombilactobacillus mellifer TaxID=1218492 RepID=A0A0F4LVY9_9LACO|nr:alpha-glucosidase [Bombilactobacillus mellifer]KJY61706.1 Oligo-1,6-glucosidase (Oligosaccharide alpha-1,6-glucosidase) [Bombilactobacillus mellifer]